MAADPSLIAYAQTVASRFSIPWPIFYNWINAESGWSTSTSEVSSAGAEGIAQIMPSTAAGWGVDPWNPQAALYAAGEHLSEYYSQFGNSWANALAAYNAGPGNVAKYGGVPPFAETQNYVAKILGAAGQGISNAEGAIASSAGIAGPGSAGSYGSPGTPVNWSAASITSALAIAVVMVAIGIFSEARS